MSARDWEHGICCMSPTLKSIRVSNSIQLLPLPSRSNPHRLPHDRPLKPRRPKLAARHRNHQSFADPSINWHKSIRSSVFRSYQPTTGLTVWNDDRVRIRGPASKSAAAGASAATAGLHVPRAAFQRPWLWRRFVPDRAADAYSRGHGLFRVGELPKSVAIALETEWKEMNIFVSYISEISNSPNA